MHRITLLRLAHRLRMELQSERAGSGLDIPPYNRVGLVGWVPQDRDFSKGRDRFLQQRQPFREKFHTFRR
jgi:hypothetical protein